MSQEIILAVIVSIDTYLAAATYCNSGIRIPPASAFVIAFIGAFVLWLSLSFSELLSGFISPEICSAAGFIILLLIGLVTIFRSIARGIVSRLSGKGSFSLKMGGQSIIVKLYLDDTAADFDNSKTLSAMEAAALAMASSLDSAATGISCGFTGVNSLRTAILTFIAGTTAIFLGNLTGQKISSLHRDFSWLGGAMLILFAIFEFI